MTTTEPVQLLVYAAVDDVNSMLPAERRLAKSSEARILGEGSCLGSLGLVHLVVAIEDRVQAAYGRAPTLMDDIAGPDNPVRTLGDLVVRIESFIHTPE